MITVQTKRDGYAFPAKTEDVRKALSSLLVYEIGYGGVIDVLEEDFIKIDTRVMGCQDETTFSGSKEDMKWLVKIAVVASMINGQVIKDPKSCDRIADRLHKFSQGNPFLVEHAAGIFLGAGTVRAVCIYFLIDNDETLIERFKKYRKEDLVALLELKLFDDCPLDELCTLVA